MAPHGAPSIVFGALSIRMCIRFVELENASNAILSTLLGINISVNPVQIYAIRYKYFC